MKKWIGSLGYLFWGIAIFGFLLMYLPIMSITLGAFFVEHQFSLEGFRIALGRSDLMSSLRYSVSLALISSLGANVLACLSVYGLQNSRFNLIGQIRSIFYLPMMLPEIVIGLSMLSWFVLFHFSLGASTLLAAHISFVLPYAMIILTLGLENVDRSFLEAAKDLGATDRTIYKSITMPLLVPSLVGSFLLCFVVSFDDFMISYFTSGVGQDTLPMKLYSLMRFGVGPELRATSVIVLTLSFIISFALLKIYVSHVRRNLTDQT